MRIKTKTKLISLLTAAAILIPSHLSSQQEYSNLGSQNAEVLQHITEKQNYPAQFILDYEIQPNGHKVSGGLRVIRERGLVEILLKIKHPTKEDKLIRLSGGEIEGKNIYYEYEKDAKKEDPNYDLPRMVSCNTLPSSIDDFFSGGTEELEGFMEDFKFSFWGGDGKREDYGVTLFPELTKDNNLLLKGKIDNKNSNVRAFSILFNQYEDQVYPVQVKVDYRAKVVDLWIKKFYTTLDLTGNLTDSLDEDLFLQE